ncbi:MAG: AAA family ATPase, partial [Chlamydiia bacterium]|nr:AAA family ATPase [Chlamydiia bacterium]
EIEALVKTHWPSQWANHQNAFFRSIGLDLQVDPPGIIPQEHLGPVRMRGKAFSIMEHHEKLLLENAKAAQNPYNILDHLTKNQNTFTREDFERFVNKHVPSEKQETVQKAFWEMGEIIQLKNPKTLKYTGLFTTQKVIEEEKQILRVADRIYLKKPPKTSNPHIQNGHSFHLKGEQYTTYNKILEEGKGITCIQGYAGSGKSYLLKALANAYEEHYEKSLIHTQGALVRAFGPDNATAKVLQEKGFSQAENIYRFLFSAQKGERKIKTGREVWILDEAGKLGNKPLLEMLKLANRKGAKVILAGDHAQFSSVERGGIFKVLCERYGSHTLENIHRQQKIEQRALAQKLAKGEIAEALENLQRLKGLHFSTNRAQAIESLVTKWAQDHYSQNKTHLKSPTSSLIVAQTNKEVHLLNDIIHSIRQKRGEISKETHTFYTPFGKLNISQGDTIEFRKNNQELGITNGTTGKLLQIKQNRLTISVEENDKKTKLVTFDPKDYCNFQLGYATTCYRSQGKTVERSYILHSPYLNKQMAYVALTRHTKEVHYFVPKTEAKNLTEIKNQALKDGSKTSTLYYTSDHLIQIQEQTKEREKTLEKLKSSFKKSTRLKGHLLNTWDHMKDKTKKAQEYFQDRKPTKAFFNPDFTTKDPISSQQKLNVHPSSPSDQIDCAKIAEKIVRNDEKAKSIENVKDHTLNKNPPFTINECEILLDKNMKIFGESKKGTLFQGYLEKAKGSAQLYDVMVAEKLGGHQKNEATFQKYQNACAQRDKAAYALKNTLSVQEITENFGSKTLNIIQIQGEKHQKTLDEKPIKSLEETLSQKTPSILAQLFPEGPTKRTKEEFRFKTNQSLAVTHSGKFYDFEKKEGGGPLQLIEREMNLNPKQAKKWAHNFLKSSPNIPPSFTHKPLTIDENEREW